MRLIAIRAALALALLGCAQSQPKTESTASAPSGGTTTPSGSPIGAGESGSSSSAAAAQAPTAPQHDGGCLGSDCSDPPEPGGPTPNLDAQDAGPANPAPPPVCGNRVLEAGELCEPCPQGATGCSPTLIGQTCAGLGLGQGTLGCSAACQLDTSSCNLCGDGQIEQGEDCEGTDLQGMTCVGLGFSNGGSLTCDPMTCRYDTSMCAPNTCLRVRFRTCLPGSI